MNKGTVSLDSLQDQLDELKRRIDYLEKKVGSLDHRTTGMIRMGGGT